MGSNMPTINRNIMKFAPTEELFGYKPDSQLLVWMKPSEFLEKASKINETAAQIDRIANSLANKMKENNPIDPLLLDIDTVNCKVIDHEGRHRAIAAEKIGIAKVPVIIYLKNDKGDYISLKEYMKRAITINTVNRCNILNALRQE